MFVVGVTCLCCGAKTIYESKSLNAGIMELSKVGCAYCYSGADEFCFGFFDESNEVVHPVFYLGVTADGHFRLALGRAKLIRLPS